MRTPLPADVVDLTERLRAAGCVFAEEEAHLLLDAAADPAELAATVDRRTAGEPLEHVLGRLDFAGLSVGLGPGVFVPRRRSELLVAAALDAAGGTAPTVVVDLCCGCGAVGLAVAAGLEDARDGAVLELQAVDVDPVAVRWTRRNLARLAPLRGTAGGIAAEVHQGDLYAALPPRLRGTVALLLAVPPYVPTSQLSLMPPEARLHEPVAALDGGPDGLDVARRIVAGAPQWLAQDGTVLVETSASQVDALVEAVEAVGLGPRVVTSEEPEAVVVTGLNRSPWRCRPAAG